MQIAKAQLHYVWVTKSVMFSSLNNEIWFK